MPRSSERGSLLYVAFTSIGVVSRLSGRHFLDLRMDSSKKSYWIYRTPEKLEKSKHERQF